MLRHYNVNIYLDENESKTYYFLTRTLAMALKEAEKQIRQNKYDTELHAAGIQDVLRIAIAVQGKEVLVEEVL